jgi:hypothetical protein
LTITRRKTTDCRHGYRWLRAGDVPARASDEGYLDPRRLLASAVRCVRTLRDDAFVIVSGDRAEPRFAVRLNVLDNLNAGHWLNVSVQRAPTCE